jgi:hypothetical protein
MINQRETNTNSGTPISAGNLVQERENVVVREYERRKELCSEIDDDKRNILTTYRPHTSNHDRMHNKVYARIDLNLNGSVFVEVCKYYDTVVIKYKHQVHS